MAKHNELGEIGEQLAVKYLVEKGYRICCRNWRYKHKEIDIITEKDNKLVVVEVKTRTGARVEDLRDVISLAKMRYLVEAVNVYVENHKEKKEIQFDVIFIEQQVVDCKLHHISDAFNALDVC